MKTLFNKAVGFAVLLVLFTGNAFAQPTLPPDVCFTVADNGGSRDNDYLMRLDPTTADTLELGLITLADGTPIKDIEATEFNPFLGILFAANGGQIGTLDSLTAVFSPIGTVGTGNHPTLGARSMTDVDGLALDPLNNIWYGSHRTGDGSATDDTPDLLFQFNPADGSIEPNAFDTDGDGVGDADYVEINSTPDAAGLPLDDIDDIAFDPFTGTLYGIANAGNASDTYIVVIDPVNGNTVPYAPLTFAASEPAPYAGQTVVDVEGLSISLSGDVLLTIGSGHATQDPYRSSLLSGDLSAAASTAELIIAVHKSVNGAKQYTDFEAFTCLVYEPASVGDTVWFDADGDGVQDPGESGIEGATVNLYYVDANGVMSSALASVETDADGNYLFTGLPPSVGTGGHYIIEFIPPMATAADGSQYPLYDFTSQDAGGDDALDSDVNPGTGFSAPIDLESGQEDLTVDAGLIPVGSIGDTIWQDVNGDGSQDAGENGFAGVKVTLTYVDPATGETVMLMTTTDDNGNYLFTDLPVGDPANPVEYTVDVDVTTLPQTGFLWDNTGDPDGGFDSTSKISLFVDPAATQAENEASANNMDQDFGYQQTDIVLPVELVRFQAAINGDVADLVWETASEDDNAGFAVEMAHEGGRFNEVAFVTGAGTTTETTHYGFQIENLVAGTYQFRLKQIDFSGTTSYSNVIEAAVEVAGEFVLRPAYPNPFNPQATISFSVRESQDVTMALYDLSGRLVKSLYAGAPEAGVSQTVTIDGSNLSSGTYMVRLSGRGISSSQSITLLK